jgi:hypothetical protein
MSKTTDWVLDMEDRGEVEFDGHQYVHTNNLTDIFEQLERAEFELDLALTNWKDIKDKINKG